MGSNPSEYNGVNCAVCGRRLPPCKKWSGFQLQTIDRLVQVDQVYVFLGGQYYRIMGLPSYYCPTDFWKPKDDYVQQQEEQRRREEAEKRRREQEEQTEKEERQKEIARQAEEERRRSEEQQQQREEKRRQREAQEEAERQMALAQRMGKARQALKDRTETGDDRVTTEVQVMTSVYNPFSASESSQVEVQAVQTRYNENIPDDVTFLESETVEEIDTVTTDIVESVQFSISKIKEGDELSGWWLKAAQTLLLTHYMQSNSFPTAEKDLLFDLLAILQTDLGDTDCLSLADSFSFLVDIRPIDITTTFTVDHSLPLTAKVASLLLQVAKHLKETNLWMQRCLYMYVTAKSDDGMMQKMYLEAFCKDWSGHNFLRFFELCKERLQDDSHKKAFHLIQTYCVRPKVVMDALDSQPHNVPSVVETAVENQDHQSLVDIIHEIRASKLVAKNILDLVEHVANEVYQILGTFSIKLDFEQRLQSSMAASKSTFLTLGNGHEGMTVSQVAESMITLYCACQKLKGWFPRRTQLVSLLLLVYAVRYDSNLLIEVMTGEGKSLIVALFAIILAHQNKHVDVVTSSPILALRDVQEWEEFFHYFGVTATHNTDLNKTDGADMDEVKTEIYKKQVVYGTVGNFAGDILRQEFEHKTIRDGRRSDAIIVDEVDMLMLDEGVQFNYLSHNAAILLHIEPVVAAVWGMIGPLNLCRTTAGEIIYAGSPKLFTQAIYESLDPEFSQVESHDVILSTAFQLGVITVDEFEALLQEDQEAKKATIEGFTIDHTLRMISGLADYENMPEFKAFTINSEGVLEAANTVEDYSSAEKLLLLGNGLACILNTREEIIDRGTEIMKTKLNFSNTESEAAIKLPKLMEDFVMNQLPVYVGSALRALHMEEDREYAITKGRIIPIDFQNSGVMELNKKWGGGLQQMLEMKHNLSMTSISLVTNFMSNVEFFSRYKRGRGIYGMSGTLGLDAHSNTTTILSELYNTQACSIPTFKRRKLFEKPAVIVESNEQWFKKIVDTVREESQEVAPWRKGRASLILCEDIKTAEDLKDYFVETEHWPEDKVYLYAHSNSKQLSSIKKKLGPGEVIIATNLAGRGTNIKVTKDVNASGGLLCLVTFLARNRRVELQAFGRTARGGKPGSVRCILNYAAMPTQYDGMNIEKIRKLRAEEESIRLRKMMDYDIKEVEVRERIFKEYCWALAYVYTRSDQRDDQKMIINSLNEQWAQWLLMRNDQVEKLQLEDLICELAVTTRYWNRSSIDELKDKSLFYKWLLKMNENEIPNWFVTIPYGPTALMTMSVANFYHYVQFGNQLLISGESGEVERAHAYYTKSIQLESRYSAIAYYNRAYAAITAEMNNHKQKAKEDIQAAISRLEVYISEVSTVSQCVSIVRQTREFERREVDDYGEGEVTANLDAQIQARFEILRFLREKMQEAIEKIDSISGDIIAKPVGIFSLIPEADYTTNVELARMWTLGFEIVYTIEKKPRFCWEGLIVFLLGVAQIVAGVLLTVFTVGAAAQFGMALIGEGISDCIDGIEGMITGEFSWAEWAITKATGIAISLLTGGVSRLASTGLKAIKAGYKIAKVGRQLKAIPKIISSTTTKSAAKANLKTASKYMAQEAVLQGVSFTTAKFMNVALEEITKIIGERMKESFVGIIRTSFTSGYLGEVVDGRFIAELTSYYQHQTDVPASMIVSGKKIFSNVGEAVTRALNSNSDVRERLATTSLSFFSQLSQESKKLRGIANLAQSAIVLTIVTDTVGSLSFLVDEFSTRMEDVCRQFITDQKIIMSSKSADPYRGYSCARKFKNDLADHVGDVFANAVAILLQGKLRPLVNQYTMTNKVGRLTNKVVGKYILKTDNAIQDLKSMQHANYIRAVGFDTSGAGPVSDIKVAKTYAKEIANSDTPGSLMELRVAAEHYGQKVTIFTEKNGKLVKDSSINPSNKKTHDEIELVYVPPPDPNSVGHYDVLISGVRRRVEADQSNCLFHAYSFSRDPSLSRSQLTQEAAKLRQTVATDITNNPSKFAEHIKLRVQMDNLRRGNRFAMIGAGPPNDGTKVLDGFYKQEVKGDMIYTMYEQVNTIKCKAWRKYNKNITVDSKNVVQEADARLNEFEVTMDNLNLADAAGKRCWDTKAVAGMIKRFKGDPMETEVSYHLCPSRGGANAGDQYANAIPASPHYNNLEKYIWSAPMKTLIANHDFTMTVRGYCGPLDQSYQGKRDIDDPTKAILDKRYALVEAVEPRAYRLQDPTTFTVYIPPAATVTQKDLDDIIEATHKKVSDIGADTDLASRTVTFYMPQDYELFTPRDLTNIQPNGELYTGELTKAKVKQKKLTVNKPPYYRSKPKGTKTAQDKTDFDNEFAKFAV